MRDILRTDRWSLPSPPRPSRPVAWASSAVFTLGVFGLEHAFVPLVDPAPYILLFLAVFLSSWVGGFGPGLLATALAAGLADYHLLPGVDDWSLEPGDFLLIGLFFVVCTVVNVLSSSLRLVLERADRTATLLREQAEEHRAVLDAVPAVVLIARDSKALEVEANRRGRELLRLSPGGTTPVPPPGPVHGLQVCCGGRSLDPSEMPTQHAASTGECVEDCALELTLPDGARRVLLGSAVPLLDAAGRPRGAVSAFQDVTELEQARRALVAEARRKDEFLALLSHELRNPLAAVCNSVHVLGRVPPGSAAAVRAHAVLSRQSAHLSRMVDDLLDTTRIARGKVRLQRAPLDLAALASRTCEDCRDSFEEAGVLLTVEKPDRPVTVDGDAARVVQMIDNLLSNALRFTDPGGRVTVTVTADTGEGEAIVTVTDTGAGIERELLGRLFTPFMQGEQDMDRSRGGLGLGLALVHDLAQMHGGAVQAHSDGPGRGATFTLRLPQCAPPAAEPAGPARASAAPRRVLLVDDNADGLASMKALLELEGHVVETAETGPQAVETARRMRPDLVICDIGLPGMDGYEVARRIRSEPHLQGVRLVALSGYAADADVAGALEAGFDAHLAKPLEPARVALLFEEIGRSGAAAAPAA